MKTKELVEFLTPNKITNRINKIDGVYYSHWNGNNLQLTVYYYDFAPLDTMKVRIADALRENFIDGSVGKVNLLSVDF